METPNLSWSSEVVRDQMILEAGEAFDSACLLPFPAFPVGIGWCEEADPDLQASACPCSLDTGSNDAIQEGRQGKGKEISFFLQT